MSRTSVATAALIAALGVSSTALAQTAPQTATRPAETAPEAAQLDEIVVTGSNIRRAAADSTNPVQVLGAEELRTSGKATIAEVLRSISASTGNTNNETQNSGWASGAAGIGLRGLSSANTLVLLNGRRVANYGFPSSGLSNTFVNVNALPLVAVQRTEVLKDGASAIYGSDAITGVVNIITRQNFQGFDFGASAGTSDEGGLDTWRAYAVGGIGDYEADGYNVLLSVEAYNRDRLDHSERYRTASGRYDTLPGGRWNGWSARGARFLVDGRSVPLVDAQGNCPEGMVLTASAPIDGRAGDTCAINLADYSTLIPSTDRYQAYLHGRVRVTDDIEAFGEVLYSHIEGTSIFGSSPYFTLEGGRFALNATTGLAELVSNNLPANSPYNPYGRAIPIEYTFFDLGQSLKTNTSDAYRTLVGIRGGDRFEWEATAFYGASRERERVAGGFANRFTLAAALANGTLNLHDPSATPQAVLDGIRLSTLRPAESVLYGADFKISGELFNLPAGPIGFAAGVDLRHESLESRNPTAITEGLQIRPAIAAIDGERDVAAVYAEFNVPIIDGLDVQLAGRADSYSDFGEAFSPKIGLRWEILDSVAFRASAAKGFRAPSLSENSASTNISYGSVIDPYDPDIPNSSQNPTFFTIGNTALEPERTYSYNAGFVFTPTSDTVFSIDYYRLELDNLIGTGNSAAIVLANNPANVIRDARGKLQAVYNAYQNLTELETQGIDFDFSQRWRHSELGEFVFSSVWSHVLDYKRQSVPGGPLLDWAGTNQGGVLPETKGTTRIAWRPLEQFEATATWYHTSSYDQATVVGGQSKVDAYNQFDIYLGYELPVGTRIHVKVDNIFNEFPPHDARFPGINGAPYDFGQYDARGRYFQVGFDHSF